MQRIFANIILVALMIFMSMTIHPAAAQKLLAAPNNAEILAISPASFTLPGQVNTAIYLSDGSVLIGGRFVSIGGQSALNSLVKIKSDGSLDPAFQVEPNLQVSEIGTAALQPDGKIVIAGIFRVLPDTFSVFLLRLNSNGTLDDSFNTISISLSGRVYALLADGDKIVIGGSFSFPTSKIARLNLDGTADPTFSGVSTGPGGTVRDIARQNSGKYIIVGDFGVIRLSSSGEKDASFVPGGYRASTQTAVLNDNSVLVGGEDICGDNLFMWYGADGVPKTVSNQDPNSLFDEITSFLPLSDGGFLIGGWNSAICINGFPTQHEGRVIRYSSTGAYRAMVSFSDASDVLALARRSDGIVLLGGQGQPEAETAIGEFDGLALLDLDNNDLIRISSFNPVVGDEAEIFDLSQYTDGKLLIAGNFSHVNGLPRPGLARLLSNFELDPSFHPFASYPSGWSGAALALPDGRAVAGFGDSGLFLIGLDGSLTDLSSYNNYDRVSSLAYQSDEKILVGSNFGLGLRRIKADFSGEDNLFIAGNANGDINDLAVVGTKIFAAGSFSLYNGESIAGLVLLNDTGVIDGGFIPPIFLTETAEPGDIQAVVPLSTGDVLVGGYFHTVDTIDRPMLVRLNSNGSVDSGFSSPTELNIVKSVCVQANNSSIWAGGSESSFLKDPMIVHLSSDGLAFSAFPSIFKTAHSDNGYVNALLCSNSELDWAGGRFSTIKNNPSYGLARFLLLDNDIYLPIIRH